MDPIVDHDLPEKVKGKGTSSKSNKKHGQGGGKGGGGTSTKLRGLEKDSVEVRTSKTLSWLLRHAAASQGLAMRPDGYVKVDDLLVHPRLSQTGLDLDGLKKIVQDDAKKRYDLVFEPTNPPAETSSAAEDGAAQTSLEGAWWIKANQGHSIKTVQLELKSVLSLEDIPSGVALHGTTVKAWKSIETQGLSKMNRNHIHLAQGISTTNAISGLRSSAQILIFIDVPKALAAGIKFFLSDNGVVLTAGDEETGFLSPEFFLRVEDIKRNPLPGWEGSGPIESKAVLASEETGQEGTSGKRGGKPPRKRGPKREHGPQGDDAGVALEKLSVSDETHEAERPQ